MIDDNDVEMHSATSDDEQSCNTPTPDSLRWDPEYLAALSLALRDATADDNVGVRPSFSSIVSAPFFHLNKWLGAKDVVVPSGPQASFAASVFNLVNSIIGAGVLALPATLSWAGLAVVCVALPLVALLMFVACAMLLSAAEHVDGVSYEFLAKSAFGHYGSRFVDVIIAVSSFLTLAAFLVLLGDFGSEVYRLAFGSLPNRVYVIITIGLVVCFPLSLLPSLNALRFASVIGVLSVLLFVAVLVYLYADGFATAPEPTLVRFDGFFRAFPVMLFAFSCETTLFPIVAEMRANVRPQARRVVAVSFGIAFTVYFLAAVIGYLLFGNDVFDNVILSIAQVPGSPIVPVLIAFAFNISTSYPLLAFAARLAITNVFWHDHRIVTERGWFIATWLFVLAAFLAASGVSLGFVLSLTGSIASSLLTLILPGLIFVRLVPTANGRRWWFQDLRKIGAMCMALLGVAIGVSGLVDTFVALSDDVMMSATVTITNVTATSVTMATTTTTTTTTTTSNLTTSSMLATTVPSMMQNSTTLNATL